MGNNEIIFSQQHGDEAEGKRQKSNHQILFIAQPSGEVFWKSGTKKCPKGKEDTKQ